jgi:PIN domain
MKPRVYIETTIPSYLAARSSRDLLIAAHQQITREWWDHRRFEFDLCISALVLQECEAGDARLAERRLDVVEGITVLPIASEASELAKAFVSGGPLPHEAAADALHLALATVYSCDYLLTWNCKHLANAEIQRPAGALAATRGWELPVVCTPEELMGY